MKKITKALIAAVSFSCAATGAIAQNYPERTVRLIVPFASGGTVDVVGRILAERLSRALGQTVIVENKAGAAGTLGADFVAKSPADGYTLLLAASSHQSIHQFLYKKLPYDPNKAFAQVALFSTVPNVLVVSSKVPAKNVAELISESKAGKRRFMGSSGTGGVNHLIGELFQYKTGADFDHVPYKGAGPANNDLLGGQIDLMFVNLPTVLSQIQSGKLRALAIAGAERSPSLPNVPTMAEAGVADFVVDSWSGVLAPAGTPKPIIDKLATEINKIARDKTVAQALAAQGGIPRPGTSEEYADLVRFETQRWAEVIKRTNVTLD
ncbi:Bug family tripartite tricarboxylate transporter substrate binding protein [Hydrogenophaga sp. BPS33]|uniref:Bug family tripartite tricarboxylate transporter substrate binding protein n=1 Tax=Hydrogenophaga sp. BPS33 TaxID=2651974 RepID=UPI00131F541C|nr:tripartite tricarboxylate transporter substrate binding protein [Hydrogenophaga sp. BPS33]QHE83409.1 tripartite tricarboxylate transporter substrate binding protein [Hydrogenophaga sp. BPS33]